MLDFRQLRAGVDGQRGSFERLLRHLAEVIPPAGATEFRPIEGAGGDGGVEAYWVMEDGTEEGYQAKFHEEAGDINWTALNGSIRTALSTHPAMSRITVGMPCDLTDVAGTNMRKTKMLSRINRPCHEPKLRKRGGRKLPRGSANSIF